MSASITSSVCALCRRPLPADDSGGSATRLCDQCRKMVDNIRPAPNRPAASPVNNSTAKAELMSALGMPLPNEASNSSTGGDIPRQEPPANPVWASTPPQTPPANSTWANTPSQTPPPNSAWSDVVMVPSDQSGRQAPFQPSTEESEYHQNWPIMVEEAAPKKRGKGILILFLFLVGTASAAVGFIVFKDKVLGLRGGSAGASSGRPNRPEAAETKPQDKRDDPKGVQVPAAAQNAVKPVAPGPSPSPVASSPVAGPSAAPSPGAQQATQTTQAAGAPLTSLQAASFPNEGSAKQFQDKLVQVGLPAYVVSAEIPHRGKWYRVRAGKFASQEEARQAAESWRKRAAAAGINLQLVPCEYQ